MTAFAGQFLRELLAVLRDASPFILFGFAIAACVHVLLPVSKVQQLLGAGRRRSIVYASLLGIPLPLCSCSVLPIGLSLHRAGASRGATVSFLISTPETGEEAIALTWGLIDPIMAIFRPFAALITALTAGVAVDALGEDEPRKGGRDAGVEPVPAPAPPAPAAAPVTAHVHAHGGTTPGPWTTRLRAGFRGAFAELFDETSYWMLTGLVVSALILWLVPPELVTRWLGNGFLPYLVMLVIGIPLYICASASTPIAAALILKGLAPGAALVLLLAGPATSLASIGILGKEFGRRVLAVYIASIAVLAVAMGLLLDSLYAWLKITPTASIGQAQMLPSWIGWPSTVVFLALLAASFRRRGVPGPIRSLGAALRRFGIRPDRKLGAGAAGVFLGAWLLSELFVVVPPGSRALIRRFGEPAGGVRTEGLHFRLPPPIDRVDVFAADEVRRLELGFRSGGMLTEPPADTLAGTEARVLEEEAVYLTGDENLLNTKSTVQYRITDPERWVYGFRDPENVLKLSTLSAAVDVLAGYGIDRVYAGNRGDVEDEVLAALRARVDGMQLGAEILRFSITDVHAPAEVHAAFRDVASAQEDKQTAINVALRYLDETVNLARGEAAGQLEGARSDAQSDVLRAQGDSESLRMRSAAYRDRRVGTKKRLYLEAVEEVLARARKIIRPGWKGSGGVDLWVGNGAAAPAPVSDVIRGGDVRRQQTREGAPEATPPGGEEP